MVKVLHGYNVTIAFPVDETHLNAVRKLIELRGFHPSASITGARWGDAAMSNMDK